MWFSESSFSVFDVCLSVGSPVFEVDAAPAAPARAPPDVFGLPERRPMV